MRPSSRTTSARPRRCRAPKFVRYGLLAGEPALAANAYEEAIAQFERALGAGGPRHRWMPSERPGWWSALREPSSPRWRGTSSSRRSRSLRRAFDYYAEAGDVSRAVTVAAYPIPLSLGTRLLTGYARGHRARAWHSSPRTRTRRDGCSPSTAGSPGSSRPTTTGLKRPFGGRCRSRERQDDAALERRTLANAAFVDVFHFRWQDCLGEGAAGNRAGASRPAT